jgi:hypothetical protein
MTTKWSDIANNNPFASDKTAPMIETASAEVVEQSSMMERCYITTADGREIPVNVDNHTRSVYPIKKV